MNTKVQLLIDAISDYIKKEIESGDRGRAEATAPLISALAELVRAG